MPSTTRSATTSTAAERAAIIGTLVLIGVLAIVALSLREVGRAAALMLAAVALVVLTGCGGSADPGDNDTFEPAIPASQPTIRKQAV